MSRPITPVPGTMASTTAATGPAAGSGYSRPTSYLGADAASIDHENQTQEYLPTDAVEHEHEHEHDPQLQRSNSQMSQSATYIPSRGNTLKKKASLHKTGSIKRSGSKKGSHAGSVRSMRLGEKDKHEPAEYNSAFYCPVPTTSAPTEILANRFQAWRRVLKDLINYFRDLHKSYETRSKTLLSASNVINNTTMPADFLHSGGIGDAAELLRDFHKQALTEANKSRDLENEVIMQLTGLRSDLSQKIKEIKSLSGDFKNSVHKEQDGTRRAVNAFQEALGLTDRDATAAAGKGDPFLMKLGVERQLERQIEEENYLHRAYLNLEASGRELESIVIGEIQKAYNVLSGILKRDADSSYDTAEKLREGPLAMARDHEWDAFVTGNTNMVDPRQPLRQVRNIAYEGKNHPAAIEVKSGMLERKSKYLKNYTPGWYILSPTHLHEFKSADQIPFQAPVMSLYLPEQKLGSHSEPGSSSHKFMVKGRQTGSMHRGHTWIFRAETHDTMMAWFNDIRELTEKRGEARNEFVRRTHARSVSGGSHRAASIGSGDSQMDEDEADKIAFAGEQSVRGVPVDQSHDTSIYGAGGATGSTVTGDDARSEAGWRPQRPQPGGRFPSDVNVTRGLQAPVSRSSGDSGDEHDRAVIAAASTLPGSTVPRTAAAVDQPFTDSRQPRTAAVIDQPSAESRQPRTAAAVDQPFTDSRQPRTAAAVDQPFTDSRQPRTAATVDQPFTDSRQPPVTAAVDQPFTDTRQPPVAVAVNQPFTDTRQAPRNEAARSTVAPSAAAVNQPFTDSRPAPKNEPAGTTINPGPIGTGYTAGEHSRVTAIPTGAEIVPDTQSQYHEWVDTAGAGLAGAGAGALGATAVHRYANHTETPESTRNETSSVNPDILQEGRSSAPKVSADPAQMQTNTRNMAEPTSYPSAPTTSAATSTMPANTRSTADPRDMSTSIYQAATMPSLTAPTISGYTSTASQPPVTDHNLIGATDIRAPTGSVSHYPSTIIEPATTRNIETPAASGLHYSSAKTEPTTVSDVAPRPAPVHSKSVQTISDLHIPGEFPRSSYTPPEYSGSVSTSPRST